MAITSQSDLNTCNDGKRESDVLLEAVKKCEVLQKKLDIAIAALDTVYEDLEQVFDWSAVSSKTTIEVAKYEISEIKE